MSETISVVPETGAGHARAGTVLVLAHRFPPTGGAGVQRNLQLARHLPAAGWEPLVVTGPGPVEDRWLPPDTALADGRLRATVHRLPATEPPQGTRWRAMLTRWLRVPGRWPRWWNANALEAAVRIGGRADVVHASVAPYTTAATAVRVARRLGKPLVLDFEDPWALDEMLVYPSRWHRRLELRRMRRVLRQADIVVMNTPEARRRVLEAFPELAPERVRAIPNAFDPADFGGPAPARADRRFRIVHAGSLHTDLGLRQRSASHMARMLGGTLEGVDFLTRSHVFLLEALAALFAERPELRPHVEVVFAGVFTDQDRAVAARYPFVELRDFVPHAETLALIRSADLLFLPMHDLPSPRRAGLVPHKTYEYLAAGRPILAAVPDGDARDLLEASGAARLCRPADTAAMTRHLLADIEAWRAGSVPRRPDRAVIERCASDRLVRELASVFGALSPVQT